MKEETYKRMQELLINLKESNPEVMNFMKCIEEFQELSLALMQILTRDTGHQPVIDEIGDCIIRLNMLLLYFNKAKVEERVIYKLDQIEKRMNKKKET